MEQPKKPADQNQSNTGRYLGIVIGIVIVVVAIALFRSGGMSPDDGEFPDIARKSNVIRVTSPRPNEVVTSPLEVTGEARGTWYFEASFPIKLVDEFGKELAVTPAEAEDDWMTEEFVPFKARLTFTPPAEGGKGMLILEKDNPSGLISIADELRIPVSFGEAAAPAATPSASAAVSPVVSVQRSPAASPRPTAARSPSPVRSAAPTTISVKAFFGNSRLDPGVEDCTRVFPVSRTIASTLAVGREALEELLKGPTAAESAQGYMTSLNAGVKLNSLVIENGTARADFDEMLDRSVGGSCRVAAISSQIRNTLMQFPSVSRVEISMNGRTDDILQP